MKQHGGIRRGSSAPAGAPSPPAPPPVAVTAPGGVPYHRLVTGWRRPLLGTALLAAAGLVVVPLALMVVYVLPAYLLGAAASVTPFPEFDTPLDGRVHRLLLLAALLPVVVHVAGWVREQRPPGTLVSVAGEVRWRWLAASLVPATAAVLLTLTVSRLVTDAPGDVTARWSQWVGLGSFLLAAVIYVVLVPLAATAVELCRGWVLQTVGGLGRLGGRRAHWLAVAAGAAALLAADPPDDPPGVLAGLVSGGMLGWLVIRTGGIEAAVAYHAVSGLATVLLDAAVGYTPRGIGTGGWLDLVFTVTQVLVFVRLTRAFLAYEPVAALLREGAPAARCTGTGTAAPRRTVVTRPPATGSSPHDSGRMATASTSIR